MESQNDAIAKLQGLIDKIGAAPTMDEEASLPSSSHSSGSSCDSRSSHGLETSPELDICIYEKVSFAVNAAVSELVLPSFIHDTFKGIIANIGPTVAEQFTPTFQQAAEDLRSENNDRLNFIETQLG